MKNNNVSSTEKNITEDSFSHVSFSSTMDDNNPRLVFIKAINKRYW